ncbi:MAG: 3-methyladenine DNA glycosylase AlkD [Flavobacteriales bacterium]
MKTPENIITFRASILTAMLNRTCSDKVRRCERYFPHGIVCLGITAAEIQTIIAEIHASKPILEPKELLILSEYLLANNEYHEEVLIAYGLIAKCVKRHFDERLLERFHYWMEHYASNWAQVDDLCIKTAYQFLLSRPHLIETTLDWSLSASPWCRRASCVIWVKFIQRKMGKDLYRLDPELIFCLAERLVLDKDEFVLKGLGWLLKVTAVHHEVRVLGFLKEHIDVLPRSTIRYALEKVSTDSRAGIMRFKTKAP